MVNNSIMVNNKVNKNLFKGFQIKESSGKMHEMCSYHVAYAQLWFV